MIKKILFMVVLAVGICSTAYAAEPREAVQNAINAINEQKNINNLFGDWYPAPVAMAKLNGDNVIFILGLPVGVPWLKNMQSSAAESKDIILDSLKTDSYYTADLLKYIKEMGGSFTLYLTSTSLNITPMEIITFTSDDL